MRTSSNTLVCRHSANYDDITIALILGRNRRRPATGLPFTKPRCKASCRQQQRGVRSSTVAPEDDNAIVVGISKAEQLDVYM